MPSPRNLRRHIGPVADAELKASIAANGRLQNLIARPATKGQFEVEAVERRRGAMQVLADEMLLVRDHEVTGEPTIDAHASDPAVDTENPSPYELAA